MNSQSAEAKDFFCVHLVLPPPLSSWKGLEGLENLSTKVYALGYYTQLRIWLGGKNWMEEWVKDDKQGIAFVNQDNTANIKDVIHTTFCVGFLDVLQK